MQSLTIALLLLSLLVTAGCGDDARVNIEIDSTPNGKISLGSGWNTWDHWWGKVPGRYRLRWNEAQWKSYLSLLKQSGADWMRIDFYYGNTEPRNDNDDPERINWQAFTFDSPRLDSFYRHLDFAQANGIDVYLTYTYLRSNHEYNRDPKSGWLSKEAVTKGFPELWSRPRDEPIDRRELAENLAATAYYLIKERGYTCIKQVSLYVEPDNGRPKGGQWKNVDGYQDTVFLAKLLTKLGIRDRVAIIAPHSGIENPEAWPPQGGDYDIHGIEDYQARVDWSSPQEGLKNFSRAYSRMAKELNKKNPSRTAALMEYGNVWTDKATGPLPAYLGTLSTSCLVFQLYNLGFGGVQRWAFEPLYHPWQGFAVIQVEGVQYPAEGPDRRDSSFRERVGTIVAMMEKGAKMLKVPETFEPQRLVNSNLRRGSTVYETEVDDPTPPGKGVCAIGARSADGRWRIGLINLYPTSRHVEVVFPAGTTFERLRWDHYEAPPELLVRARDWLGSHTPSTEPFRFLFRAVRRGVRDLRNFLGQPRFSDHALNGGFLEPESGHVSLTIPGRSINFLIEPDDRERKENRL